MLQTPPPELEQKKSRSGASLLKMLIEERRALLAPGAGNALTARIIEDLGYEVAYISGAGIANTMLGVPDIGLLTLTELVDTTWRISDACALPLIVDIDTGFGNAVNTGHTIKAIERAGACGVQIEDQDFPKRCGHFEGKDVIRPEEMISKIKAAADARQDQNLQIIARTDSRAMLGLEEALDRAQRYREAGADITFVEAPLNRQEMLRIGQLPYPQVANLVVGGHTPLLSQRELKELGFSLVLYANAALQASVRAMQIVLGTLKENGELGDAVNLLATFQERQRVVKKDRYDAFEVRYRVG